VPFPISIFGTVFKSDAAHASARGASLAGVGSVARSDLDLTSTVFPERSS
jgi:hypothetical protein